MKKILLALTLMVAAVSYGQTEKGKWMVGSNLGLSFSSENVKVGDNNDSTTKTTFIFNPDASYFLADNLAVGVGLDYNYSKVKGSDGESSFGVMPNIKYFFPQGQVAPFVGLGVGYRLKSEIPTEGGNAINMGGLAARVEGGVAYFLTESLAATASVRYDYTSVTHKDTGNTITKTGLLNVGIGVAYFF